MRKAKRSEFSALDTAIAETNAAYDAAAVAKSMEKSGPARSAIQWGYVLGWIERVRVECENDLRELIIAEYRKAEVGLEEAQS